MSRNKRKAWKQEEEEGQTEEKKEEDVRGEKEGKRGTPKRYS